MIDSLDPLEAFFARRDRRKFKQMKLTFTENSGRLELSYCTHSHRTADVVNQKRPESPISEVESSHEDAVVEDPESSSSGTETVTVKEGDDEWNDFQQEVAANLHNLKISTFRLEDPDTDEDSEESKEDASRAPVVTNAWKVVDEQVEKSVQETICEAVDAGADMGVLKAKVTAMNAKALLKMQEEREMQPSLLPRAGGRKKAAAPNMKNAEAFPSLAEAQSSVGRKAKKNANKEMKNGGPSSNTRGGGSGAVYRPPVGGNGSVYRPPVGGSGATHRTSEGDAMSRERSGQAGRSSCLGKFVDTSAINRNGASASGGESGASGSGSWARGGESGASGSGAWTRGGGSGASGSGAWTRGGGSGASGSGAWTRGGGSGGSGAWARGGGSGTSAGGSWTSASGNGANGSSSWASISSGASSSGGSDRLTSKGSNSVYVPPSMRTVNRFGALNDQN